MAGNGLLDSGGGGGGGVEEQHLRAAEPCTRRRRVASHEAVERLEGLAQDYYEEVFSTYMWAVVEESKAERRQS